MATEFHLLCNEKLQADQNLVKKLETLGKVHVHTGGSFPSLATPTDKQIKNIFIHSKNYGQKAALSTYLQTNSSASVMECDDTQTLLAQSEFLLSAFSPHRSSGAKCFLAPGSTIYSESFFDASGSGSKLDPAFYLAKKTLSAAKAVSAWSSLSSLLYFSFQSLPSQGTAGTGERVDVQIGADGSQFAISIKVNAKIPILSVRENSVFSVPKDGANFFEIRNLEEDTIELNAVFFSSEEQNGHCFLTYNGGAAANEEADFVREFVFHSMQEITTPSDEGKRKVRGFKKKFSETISTIKADEPQAEQKIVVSGATELGKGKPNLTVVKADTDTPIATAGVTTTPVQSAEKSESLYLSKIQGLEETLKQREELIAKLNKEIEEIKDPLKMGVISSIKDNQSEGLKGTIKRLETELAESAAREKELMGVVDKAIQLKDDAIKKYKEVETKLRQSSGGNNSKVVQLEKQLEEAKRQNKEMAKRVGQLTEQLQAAGKRVA